VNSSARFWLVAGALTALAVGLEAGPRTLGGPSAPPPPPTESLDRFLDAETGAELAPVLLRQRLPGWAGRRWRVGSCTTTAMPLAPGGDYDIDVRRMVGPGETLAFVYAGRVFSTPPRVQANVGVMIGLAQAALGLGRARPDYYVGLIQGPGCKGAAQPRWGRLWGVG
jgi:hypothetical protein